jgi:hypothetical protein
MGVIIVSKLGFLSVPLVTLQFIDKDEIVETLNEQYNFSPSFARKLFHYYVRVIKGASIVAGHIESVKDIYPLIDKLEQKIEKQLTDEQVAKIEKATENMLADDGTKNHKTEDVTSDHDEQLDMSDIDVANGEDIIDAFIRKNSSGGF